jgi:hypothetical protein
VGQDLLIIEDSWSHSDTRQMVGLLWMSDQLVAKTSTWQYTALNRQRSMPLAGFELTLPASERPQTHTLDRVTTGFGQYILLHHKNVSLIPLLFFPPSYLPYLLLFSFSAYHLPLPHLYLSFLLHSFALCSSIFHSVFTSISRRAPQVRYMFCILHTDYTSISLCILM